MLRILRVETFLKVARTSKSAIALVPRSNICSLSKRRELPMQAVAGRHGINLVIEAMQLHKVLHVLQRSELPHSVMVEIDKLDLLALLEESHCTQPTVRQVDYLQSAGEGDVHSRSDFTAKHSQCLHVFEEVNYRDLTQERVQLGRSIELHEFDAIEVIPTILV